MVNIRIIPMQFSRVGILERMLDRISQILRSDVRIELHPMDLTDCFDPVRSQYNANTIINKLSSYDLGSNKIIGVTDLDLFIPVLSYVFGQAYLGGTTALISGHRLENSRYGLPEDQVNYEQRLLKCLLHELGHTFGLKHCLNPSCIMLSTTYVEEMDHKSDYFCPNCLTELKRMV